MLHFCWKWGCSLDVYFQVILAAPEVFLWSCCRFKVTTHKFPFFISKTGDSSTEKLFHNDEKLNSTLQHLCCILLYLTSGKHFFICCQMVVPCLLLDPAPMFCRFHSAVMSVLLCFSCPCEICLHFLTLYFVSFSFLKYPYSFCLNHFHNQMSAKILHWCVMKL